VGHFVREREIIENVSLREIKNKERVRSLKGLGQAGALKRFFVIR